MLNMPGHFNLSYNKIYLNNFSAFISGHLQGLKISILNQP
jgi:hypothetical protein